MMNTRISAFALCAIILGAAGCGPEIDTGGGGGSGGEGSGGGGGGGGTSTSSCNVNVGAYCTSASRCCDDPNGNPTQCIGFGGVALCAARCTAGRQCTSGCCTRTTDGYGVCAPRNYCP